LEEIRELLIKSPNFNLSDIDPDNTFGKNRSDLELDLTKLRGVLSDLQNNLFVEHKNSLLIVLQGMDTSGKDATIEHDFLWRIHKAVPPIGFVGVFNRSHYEDIVEARNQKLVSKSELDKRYNHINCFEKILTENRVKIIKFFLHISKKEQKKRLDERASDPEKRWKEDTRDYKRRKKWQEYLKAYTDVITYCGINNLPWYVIPSNKKWFRNWIIAKIICDTLQDL
jgi:polyphosphate kinase 2 (PPK2 family)